MNASAITAIRTAAVSADKLLAREDIRAGDPGRRRAGPLAHRSDARDPRLVADPDRLADARARRRAPRRPAREAIESPEEAVRGADVVVTATNSRAAGCGRAHTCSARRSRARAKLDTATIADCALFVDRRESTVNEAGDYLMPLAEGAILGPEHIRAEIGEL